MKSTKPASRRFLWPLLALFYGGVLLIILVNAYQGTLPSSLTQNDKLGHLVLYGIAAYLGHLALRRRHSQMGPIALPLFPLLFGSFTIVEEFSQLLSPNRSFDGWDLIASFAGIGIGYWLAERGRRSG